MKQNKEIPAGYKDSPLGIIPESWKIKKLGEIGKIYSGGTPDTDNPLYWNGEINWCTPTDITALNGNKYIGNTITKITTEGLNNSSAKLLPPNSIIVCTRASIGKTVISKFNIATNQGFKNIVPNENIDTHYLYYVVSNSETKLLKLGSGSTFLEVSKSDFENLKFAFPPIVEQVKIAQILSLWDNAIEKQKKLVEKLERKKRAVMQSIMTGKIRLFGFTKKWGDTELGDLLDYIQPTPYLVRDTLYDEKHPVPVLTAGKTFVLGYTNETDGVFVDLPVIIFDDFTTASKFVNFPFKAKSSAMKILKAKKNVNIKFVYEAMKQIKYSIGGHERHWISKFSFITIPLPGIEEQTAIAEVFTTADQEINSAKAKLNSLIIQKKGLMQQLLTGKTRVKL